MNSSLSRVAFAICYISGDFHVKLRRVSYYVRGRLGRLPVWLSACKGRAERGLCPVLGDCNVFRFWGLFFYPFAVGVGVHGV